VSPTIEAQRFLRSQTPTWPYRPRSTKGFRIGEVEREEFDKPGGPLETFSQRITMGQVLQIYGPDTKYNLDLLRLLRNTFAHAHIPVTFETQEIAAAIGLFRSLPRKRLTRSGLIQNQFLKVTDSDFTTTAR
jgi:hypothetical protein